MATWASQKQHTYYIYRMNVVICASIWEPGAGRLVDYDNELSDQREI